MRVHLNVPVFSSPSEAFGSASGLVNVATLPNQDSSFPWPQAWVQAKPQYLSSEQSLVASIGAVEGVPLVVLDGIVCWSREEARDCARFLEQTCGLFFDKYDIKGQSA
ncbi:hypothetical protein [Ramlibacter pallidus]|uniref:Uncharacterized protein n=1 Tax=Ramlibacter pallidus TaxID=2780087 RepID=A0ABR9S6Q4_9BURK|nr:hypothetical protein [Ramlibacter pallidus]MBE7368687.1 hypothetical protein [Ramlibacter pallidus]